MIFCLLTFVAAARGDQPAQAPGPPEDPGPPQFLTFPILTHVAEAGLVHGHFVFGGDAATPAPLAPKPGSADYSPAPILSASTIGTGADRDVSNSPDSYEGETGASSAAASSGNLVVAGSNWIYPGNCSTFAATGTFGDCAPRVYSSVDGTAWLKSALPRTWNGITFGIGFDPALDVDKTGTFYFFYGVAPLSGNYPNAVVAVKSSDGASWTQLTPVTFNTSKYFDDKYYLAIDRSNGAYANRLYVAWDRNTSTNQILAHPGRGQVLNSTIEGPILPPHGTAAPTHVRGGRLSRDRPGQ